MPDSSARSEQFSPELLNPLEDRIAQFEKAWSEGVPPPISAFLPDEPRGRHFVLVELVHIDLEFRLKAGQAARVESYLDSFPELAEKTDAILSLVQREYELRQRREPECSPDEYLRRFPTLGPELKARLSEPMDVIGNARADAPAPSAARLASMPPTPAPGQTDRPVVVVPLQTPAATWTAPSAIRPATTVDALPGPAATLSLEVPPPPVSLAASPEPEARSLPSRIGRFDVRAHLGEGAFGVVYRAYDAQIDREVALKVAKPQALSSERRIKRFLQEARAAGNLRHPNIVPVYDSGRDGEQFYIASAFIAGHSLDAELDRRGPDGDHDPGRPFAPREAARLVQQLAEALAYAHKKGVIHRDIKPANILLDEQGEPLLVDFGLAARPDGDEKLTQEGAMMGTPAYVSPEQSLGKAEAASDQYSLGCTFYELLTGHTPFSGPPELQIFLHQTQEVPSPRWIIKSLPRDLETICLKCLAKAPAQRYGDCQALADDLRRWLDDEPILARRMPLHERLRKWFRKEPALATSIFAAVFLGLALIASILFIQQRRVEQLELTRQRSDLAHRERDPIENAIADRKWQDARALVGPALARISDVPAADELRGDLQALAQKIEQGIAWRQRLAEFQLLALEAVYRSTQSSSSDPAVRVEQARTTALAALEKVGITLDSGSVEPHLPAEFLDDTERRDVAERCRDLWLLLVRQEGEKLPGLSNFDNRRRLEKALALLDRIGLTTRSAAELRISLLEGLGDAERVKQARAALPKEAVDAADHFGLGMLRFHEKNWPAAAAHFQDAVRLSRGHFWAEFHLALCQLHLAGQRPTEAAALDRLTAALTHLNFCLERRPDFIAARLLRGHAQGELGFHEDQLAQRERAERREEHRVRRDAYWKAADDDFRDALARLQKEPKAEEKYAVLHNRALLRIHQARYAEAEDDARAAIALKPEQVPAHVVLAEVKGRQQQYEQALAELDAALKLDPRQPDLHRLKARIHEKAQNAAAAVKDYETANALELPAAVAARANDHVERGVLLVRLTQFAEAVQAFDAALQLAPELARPRLLRGAALRIVALKQPEPARRATLEAALRDLDEYAVREKPDFSFYQTRGRVRTELALSVGALREPADQLRALELHRGAVEDYGRALDLKPDTTLQTTRAWELLLTLDAPKLALPDFDAIVQKDGANLDACIGLSLCRIETAAWRKAVDDTEKTLEQIRKAKKESAFVLYHAARVFAAAAGRVDALAKPDRTMTEQRQRWEARALELLRESLTLTPAGQRSAFWHDSIRGDRTLAPLRGSTGFRKLADDFGKTAPEKDVRK